MASKPFFTLFLLISSLAYVAFSEGPDLGSILNAAGIQGGGSLSFAGAMPCMQKLIPCKPFLNASSPPPPPTCCDPLNEMIANDTSCLCSLFSNPDLLKSINVSRDDILKLPDACGATIDVSVCNKVTASPSESNSSSDALDTSISDLTSPESSSAARAIFGVFGLVVSSMALVMAVA